MDLNTIIARYKNVLIPEIEAEAAKESDPSKRKTLEEFVISLRKDLRSKEIQKRLIVQYVNREFIGYVCFASQIIEFEIKESVYQYEQLLSLLSKTSPIKGDIEKKTLGVLIEDYEECIDDSTLLSKLKDFNAVRIKAIHKLFITDYTIEEVEREIEEQLFYEDLYKSIVNPLLSYRLALTSKTARVKYAAQMPPAVSKIFELVEKQLGVQFVQIEKHIKT